MRSIVLLLLPLVVNTACSDYNLGDRRDGNGTLDTDGDGGTDDKTDWAEECDEPSKELGTVLVDESCEEIATVGSWSPVIEWRSTVPGNSYTTPVVGQLTDDNGDGLINDLDMPDIVVANGVGVVYVLSGDGSGVHWQAGALGAEPSTPAIGDLDGDGRPEVVASGSTGIFAYRGDTGAQVWASTAVTGGRLVCGGVAIYDLDSDGHPEVIQGAAVLDGRDGRLKMSGNKGWGTGYTQGRFASFGVVADTNLDGVNEVIVGNAAYNPDGSILWQNNFPDGFVAVGNFDDDPYAEVVVSWYPGLLRLQDHDGTFLWSGTFTGSTIGPPTIADFDGDGKAEIGVAGNGVYVVVDGDGSLIWSRPINDYSSGFTGSAVFDFEGDGLAEVVFADENDLWVFDGATGAVKLQEPQHSSATCSEYPVVADVDNDGAAEIVYTSSAYSGTEMGVTVVGDLDGTWQPSRGIWNQHSYHITNVLDSSGKIPVNMDPNWRTYNTFRSGDLSAATGGAFADAVPVLAAVCVDECTDGRIEVIVQVGNEGVADLPSGVPFSLYAKTGETWTLIESRRTPGDVPSGSTTPSEVFSLTIDQVPDGIIKLVVDDEGGLGLFAECHEDNNVLEIRASCE
ncbi:MAG: hypothetical protein ACI9MC_000905 [Kiritimatiellia bacterium]|jgi:hypothetical protein